MKKAIDQFKRDDAPKLILQKLYDETSAGLKRSIVSAKAKQEFRVRTEMTVEEILLSERDDLNEPWDHYDRIIKQLKPVKFVSVKSVAPS